MEFLGRWFTGSNSDGGLTKPNAPRSPKSPEAKGPRKLKKGARSRTRFAGGSDSLGLPQSEAKAARKTLLGQ